MSKTINNQYFFSEQTTPVWSHPPIVVAWQFSSAENLGALLRVCDNFGVKQVLFVGDESAYRTAKIKRNATTAFNKINFKFIGKNTVWDEIPKEHLKIAVDTTLESVSLIDYDFKQLYQNNSSFCFFFGNETIGLEDETINKCDASLHIPMIGQTYSMNVVQSASVVLFESVKQCLDFSKN